METQRISRKGPGAVSRARAVIGCLLAAVKDPELVEDAQESIERLTDDDRRNILRGLQVLRSRESVLACGVPGATAALAHPDELFAVIRARHAG